MRVQVSGPRYGLCNDFWTTDRNKEKLESKCTMTALKLIPHIFQSPIRTTTQHHKGTNPRKNCSNFTDPCEQTGCTCISHLVRLLFDVSKKLSKEQEKLKVSSLGFGGIFHQRAKTVSNAKKSITFYFTPLQLRVL